ncbi:helix-turn-helix domain-containing protein [Beduini massiliensis]|uniref:helix-turn-helix domain-containing protein n=1 Tax=Beduini massiliensis TaxID=1585974 RepID=UPI000694181B|nr:helix-turn-helix transcriptional regulator [Beduini massiliensis]
MNSLKVGQLILALRKEKKMTQKDLADRLMISDRTVSKWGTWSFPNKRMLETIHEIPAYNSIKGN